MTDPTREAALALLTAVLDRHRTLDVALDALPPLEPRDRAAAHRLAAAVLRRLGSLDAALEPYLAKAPPPPVRHVLRLGAAGLLLLGTPPHAAVATAVALARSRRPRPVRRPGQRGAAPPRGRGRAGGAGRRSTARGSTPRPGSGRPGAPRRAPSPRRISSEAPLDLTLQAGAAPPPGGVALPTGSLRFPPAPARPSLPGFAEGAFWVQDAAAALPARLLGASAGRARRRSLRRPRRQDRAARRRRRHGHRGRARPGAPRPAARELWPGCGLPPRSSRRTPPPGARRRRSTRCCSTRRAAPPAPSAAIPTCRT